MTERIKWGLLATGAIAQAFARGVQQSQTGALVAVGSRSQEKADAFAADFKIGRAYGSYEALLADPEVEAIYVSTPHPYHGEWTIKAAEAGKHVLVEKPMGLNQYQAQTMIEAAVHHKVFLMEAFMYRCHPQTRRLVELIRDGAGLAEVLPNVGVLTSIGAIGLLVGSSLLRRKIGRGGAV